MVTLQEWRSLVSKHHVQGLRVANAILHRCGMRETAEAAKDVVQEAWMISWQMSMNPDHARALFFRSVRLRAYDAVRKALVRARPESSPEPTVRPGWGAQAHPKLLRAVERMTCEGFDVWYLSDVKGLTDKEAQEELQISQKQQQNRLYRARKMIDDDSESG